MSLLVLGLGNVLCEDDGAGVVAVEHLRERWQAPVGVEVADGGTLGLALLPLLQQADHVILLDAVAADAPPGTIVRYEGSEVTHAARLRLSPHQVGVSDVLGALAFAGGGPVSIVMTGVVPERMGVGLGCSPAVRRRLPDLAAAAVREAQRLGFFFEERNANHAAGAPDRPDPLGLRLR